MSSGVIKVFDAQKTGASPFFVAEGQAKVMSVWTDFPSDQIGEMISLDIQGGRDDSRLKADGVVLDTETEWTDGKPVVSIYFVADKIRIF